MEHAVIHANCQGEPLLERLLACPEFAARYQCEVFVNYVRQPIPEGTLEQCGLFLYQHLGSKWEGLASDRLLERVPDSARTLCIPNMFFTGYWPLWSGEPGFNYRDSHLDALIDAGLSAEEVLTLFLRGSLSSRFDLGRLLRETLDREREREAHTPVKYVGVIERDFRSERLFNTVNHPGSKLLNHAATEILKQLGFEPPDMSGMSDPFPEFEQPIHPQVAAFHKLSFVDASTEYNVYGCRKTFVQYAARYVEARLAGVTDFIEYLASC
jgi:hypothetical protein